jgi:tol-pal system protein YbgF
MSLIKCLIFRAAPLLVLPIAVVHAEPVDLQDEAGYAASTLDARVARLEKKAANQPLTEVMREMDRLKEDVKKLRGQVEELRNTVERQSHQDEGQAALVQRNADLEAKLSSSQATGTGSSSPVPEQAAGVEPPKVLAPSAVDEALSAPKSPPVAVDPFARQKEYEHAFETLKAAKYTDAISEFQAFVAKYPSGDYSDSAHYWLGEALYVNRAFVPAREAFRKMIADFPQSTKVPDAKLKLAFIEYENQQYPKARELLNDIVKSYPGTATSKMAEKRLERMRQENR